MGLLGLSRCASCLAIFLWILTSVLCSPIANTNAIQENKLQYANSVQNESQDQKNPGSVSDQHNQHRGKRSPFIMAFQVTRPPGMFQLGLRRPVIMSMMSNLTRSLMTSNISDLLRRGFMGPLIGSLTAGASATGTNSTVVDAAESRQEDLDIYK